MTSTALAQQQARDLVEQAAEAMGGLDRLQALDNFVLTGFGQYLNQSGGGNPSPHPRAPSKWQAANAAERSFDLVNERAVNTDRRGFMFPFAIERGHSWDETSVLQTGVAMFDHPLPAVLEALDPETQFGGVHADGNVSGFNPETGVEDMSIPSTHSSSTKGWLVRRRIVRHSS